MPLYVQYIRSGALAADAHISDLDRQLPKEVILHFRKLAHARIRKLELAQLSQGDANQPQPQQRTWVQWMGFGTAVEGNSTSAAADGENEQDLRDGSYQNERAYLTDEEVQALEDMVQAQAWPLKHHALCIGAVVGTDNGSRACRPLSLRAQTRCSC